MKKTISLMAGAVLLATGKTPVTYSETVIDDHAVNVIAKANGQVINKGVRRIDADGNTMTIAVVQIDQSGKETPIKLVFKRVAG